MTRSPAHRAAIAGACLLGLASGAAVPPATGPTVPVPARQDKLDYWNQQRRGANGFNRRFSEQWFADLRAAGISFCRLGIGKVSGTGRDFLIGDADHYTSIPPTDLAHLREILGWARKYDVQVVIAPLSLPGSRWTQQNGGTLDGRLWTEPAYTEQAAAFWRDLAAALKDQPHVVGYEILNEPAPERAVLRRNRQAGSATRTAATSTGNAATLPADIDEWSTDLAALETALRDTPADLNRFYESMTRAIRSTDPWTPIVVSSGFYGFAGSMRFLRPLADDRVIYSFHNYEPFAFTNFKHNAGRYTYPGPVPNGAVTDHWDADRLARHVQPVADWAAQHRIPSSRIYVGEFGCNRRVPGAEAYLRDSVALYNRHGWHWAFYGFREDEWDGLDYEVGTRPLPWSHWQAIERGESPAPPRKDNPLWKVLIEGVRGQ